MNDLEIVLFIVGCFVLYLIIRIAIDHSYPSAYLKQNNKLLKEIRDLLKEQSQGKEQSQAQEDDTKGQHLDEKG